MAARRATLPNEHLRPVGPWMTSLPSAVHCAADTFQVRAAACNSMILAAAPIRRNSRYQPRTEKLPTVACKPNRGLL